MSKPRVLAVLPGVIPSTLISVVKPLISLHRAGRIRARIVLENSASPRDVRETDLVVFCRNVEPRHAWVRDLAQSRRLPYVYVLDDDLFDVPEGSEVGRYHHGPDRLQELERYVSGAGLVSVFSPHLADRLRKVNPRINLLAGWVDFDLVRPGRPRALGAPIRIVYATSRGDDQLAHLFLEELIHVLDDPSLQAEAYFWGFHPEELAMHPRVHFIDFTPDYDAFLGRFSYAGFDVGLAPLLDDAFHRSKSNNKFREYAASRIAGVYSNVEVYSRCVVHEETGLIVQPTPGAWYEAIVRLAKDRSLRERIQYRAWQFAVEHYSLDAAEEAWWGQIQTVLADTRSPPQILPGPGSTTPAGQQRTSRALPAASSPGGPGYFSRLRLVTPRRALASLRRRSSDRWVMLKLQLATHPISALVRPAARRLKRSLRAPSDPTAPLDMRVRARTDPGEAKEIDKELSGLPAEGKGPGGEVCAIVVTFKPDAGIGDRLSDLARGVAHLIVVDNTEGEDSPHLDKAAFGSNTEICRNGSNFGLAAALNMGVGRGVELGYEYILILDQDSVPQSRMLETLVAVYRNHPERDQVAIVAPQPLDPGLRSHPRFLRRRKWFLFGLDECKSVTLEDVTIVISSGVLLPAAVFVALGPFRDDFFIDYVDTEYCLRALSRGYRIVVAGEARLHHRLGQQRAAALGPFVLYPTMHPVYRWYYMARNRIPTLARYGCRFPHWFAFDLVHGAYVVLRMLLTEDARARKLAAFARGTLDGFRGKMGPMPRPTNAAPFPDEKPGSSV